MGIRHNDTTTVRAGALTFVYNGWRRTRGYSQVSEVTAAAEWKRLGLERVRRKDGAHYRVFPMLNELKRKLDLDRGS
jgi:hypothetical protein